MRDSKKNITKKHKITQKHKIEQKHKITQKHKCVYTDEIKRLMKLIKHLRPVKKNKTT